MSAAQTPQELEALALKLGIACREQLSADEVTTGLLQHVPLTFARSNLILPLFEQDGVITVAISSASGLLQLDELRLVFDKPLQALLLPIATLSDLINHVYAGVSGTAREVLQELQGEDLSTVATEFNDPKDLLDLSDEAPVIRLLNSILSEAVKERVSDVHIEPYERDLLVRFRIDGILRKALSPKNHSGSAGVARQDYGRPQHRRKAPAAGWPHSCAGSWARC
jgi:general secretion pathway protein E